MTRAEDVDEPTEEIVADAETDAATDPETDAATDPETDAATDPETDAEVDASVAGAAAGVGAAGLVAATGARPHEIRLDPPRTRAGSVGVHRLVVDNLADAPLTLGVETEVLGGGVSMEPDMGDLVVAPLGTAATEFRLIPAETFLRGPMQEHMFRIHVTGPDGEVEAFDGTFEQIGRIRTWQIVLLSVLGGILLFLLLWFALLEPAIRDIAQEEAQDALAADRAAQQLRMEQLERAAEEAEELPLGQPADVRLTVDPSPGETATDSVTIDDDRVVSITDIVLQNPTGAIGSVLVRRDDEVLLQSELANFRDLDFHFVAAYTFEAGSALTLEVTCGAAGPSFTTCPVSASFVGFDDEA